ncbi:MAG: transaldolase family protein [Candidatus Altiarchaeia archaeon]
MAIFLDTCEIEEIKKYHGMGIIRGVTTNPTILVKSGVTGGLDGIKKRCVEIAKIIRPLPLSIELTNNDTSKMLEQAIEFSKWADNAVIKVPIHGPHGELENIRIIHELEVNHDVRVNVTAMMSAQQGILAALAGATYVSLFCGRVNNMGYNSVDEISKLRRVLDIQDLDARIICASTREVLNVIEWLDAGAHLVTVLPNLIEGMLVHPYSKETVKMFISDAMKLQEGHGKN